VSKLLPSSTSSLERIPFEKSNVEVHSAEFLLTCSKASLQDFELARLNSTANVRKQINVLESELLKLEAEALVARWLLDHRLELLELGSTRSLQKTLQFPDGASV
jgi:hypothetical protein